jgi:hypothetical protein
MTNKRTGNDNDNGNGNGKNTSKNGGSVRLFFSVV